MRVNAEWVIVVKENNLNIMFKQVFLGSEKLAEKIRKPYLGNTPSGRR